MGVCRCVGEDVYVCSCLCDVSEQGPSVSMCLCESKYPCVSLGGGRAQCVPGVAMAPAPLDCGVALAPGRQPRRWWAGGDTPPGTPHPGVLKTGGAALYHALLQPPPRPRPVQEPVCDGFKPRGVRGAGSPFPVFSSV